MACHRFHRLDSQALEETTAIWKEYVLKLPQPSNLTSAPMQKVLGTATRGYLGLLDEFCEMPPTAPCYSACPLQISGR